jgi:hypothetical protein
MDTTLENLKQLLQFQLDFLENLDSEAGRRMEKLESSVSQASVVNGATIDLMVMSGVMWGFVYWFVSWYSMFAT